MTRCTRSRPGSAAAMCGLRPAGTRPTSPPACTARCTSVVTGCMKPASRRRSRAVHSAPASHSGCTSPRAGCGRTWSDGAARSAACSRPDRPASGRLTHRPRSGCAVPGRQSDQALLHPRRVRRSHLRAPHRAPVRARAATDRRHASRSMTCPKRGTRGLRSSSACGWTTTPTACSRMSIGRPD